MDIDTVDAIKVLLEYFSNKNSSVVDAAFLTVLGMFSVSVLAAISQWKITKFTVQEERDRLTTQLSEDLKARQHEKWESMILESVSELLNLTNTFALQPDLRKCKDPSRVKIDKDAIFRLIPKLQLLLNTSDPKQNKLYKLIDELDLLVFDWNESVSKKHSILESHNNIRLATQELIYQPNKSDNN